jgi:hypothetical protein
LRLAASEPSEHLEHGRVTPARPAAAMDEQQETVTEQHGRFARGSPTNRLIRG